jgi:hypothetical protein
MYELSESGSGVVHSVACAGLMRCHLPSRPVAVGIADVAAAQTIRAPLGEAYKVQMLAAQPRRGTLHMATQ